MDTNFSISSGEHEIPSVPSSQRHSNQVGNDSPFHCQHCFLTPHNSAGLYVVYIVNSITVFSPAGTPLGPRGSSCFTFWCIMGCFGILWAVLVGGLLGPPSPPLRVTPRVNFFGAYLLVIAPLCTRNLPFAEASVPEQLLLELHPYSASNPLKACCSLHWPQPMVSLAAVPSGSRAPFQYLSRTQQLPPVAQVESKSSILPTHDITYSVGATCPSWPPVKQMAPLPGNLAHDYAKCVDTSSRF
uniref:Uncharacterized protein n=1 Tax=Rousettus aegyptiacus TaxID=9407 RepID=A0A7J8C2D9_ROUAE|nr:hypothetical protein HJG63_009345 [Rousettus aegyptiacus]